MQIDDIIATVTIPLSVLESMKRIIDYGITDEKKHYEETFGPDYFQEPMDDADIARLNNHIYTDYELVNRFLHSQDLNAELYNQGIK